MKNKMKAFVSEGYGKGKITEVAIPQVEDDLVLVKVCYCGICGTDQDLFSSDCSFVEDGLVTYPIRPGHEWSGVVEAVGSNVTGFKKGDKVVGDNAVTCGVCEDCKKGDFGNCKHQFNVGTINPVYDGAFSEYYIAPQRHLHKIPEGISLKEASLAEPLSVAYGGIKKMNITDKSVVAVIGTGCIGMAAIVLAKCLGAKEVIMVGRNPVKLEVAKALGASIVNTRECDPVDMVYKMTNGKGADFVLECSGAKETFKQSVAMSAYRATVALIGFYASKENEVNVDAIVSKALSLYGVMGAAGDMAGALEILKKHRPSLLPIITDDLPFEDCIKGFDRKNYPYSIKTTVTISEE